MDKPYIKIENLTKEIESEKVLNHISLEIPKQSIIGFVGRNGSGKTMLFRAVAGLITPTEGTITIDGQVLGKDISFPPSLGLLIENIGLWSYMSGFECLQTLAEIKKQIGKSEILQTLERVGLDPNSKKRVGKYSLGMRQRLGIAVALCGDPDFLVLDEPVNGLDPQGIIEMRELILRINREHQITVLISSHILDELAKLATHYGFIDNGTIVKEISAADLESVCRKCVFMEVSNTKALACVLDRMKIEYKILSDTTANVFTKIKASLLISELTKENCEVISMQERTESLESFYISLVGGEKHD